MNISNTLRRPSAFLPIAMSLFALAVIFVHIVRFGSGREPDEGTAAHLWQLAMAGQMPIIAWFAIRWLPQAPRSGFVILLVQVVAAIAAFAPVYLLNW